MKKLLSLFLTLALCAACLVAVADEPVTTDFPKAGLKFVCPQAFIDAEGLCYVEGPADLGNDSFYVFGYYIGVTEEEYDQVLNERDRLNELTAPLFYAFTLANGLTLADLSEATGLEFSPEDTVRLGQLGSISYWLYMMPDADFGKRVAPDFAAEYEQLCGLKDEIAAGFTCYEPVSPVDALKDTVISFEATDLDGNTVSSADLFAQHEITMVNLWATWCGPCISELPDLQAIHTRIAEKDCSVLGLLGDNDVDAARSLIKENGITYPVVIGSQEFIASFPFKGYPTTFYVDRNGVFLGTLLTGVQTSRYEPALNDLLSAAK